MYVDGYTCGTIYKNRLSLIQNKQGEMKDKIQRPHRTKGDRKA